MTPIHHFAYGWINPVMGFGFSFLGSLLGLMLATRARVFAGSRRASLLIASAVVLGSTGIWLTHFIAMIGFDVPALAIRYDVSLTLASVLIALLVLIFGLMVAGMGRPSAWRIALGGPVTGLGVATMHYTGMASIQLNGTISYNRPLFWTSVAIAVVAATVALILAVTVRGIPATVAAALVMAAAVCTMHYTGMAAMSVTPDPTPHELHGVAPLDFVAPVAVLACLVIVAMSYTLAGFALRTEPIQPSQQTAAQPPQTAPTALGTFASATAPHLSSRVKPPQNRGQDNHPTNPLAAGHQQRTGGQAEGPIQHRADGRPTRHTNAIEDGTAAPGHHGYRAQHLAEPQPASHPTMPTAPLPRRPQRPADTPTRYGSNQPEYRTPDPDLQR